MRQSAAMSRCPKCSADVPVASRFCPNCAQPTAEIGATQTSLPTSAGTPFPGRNAPSAGRFLPGSMIAERYRVVGQIGAGGMGEVYRADDLKLGQTVALKFLPKEFAQDAQRRERLMNEVRMALQITHPNVCRVYDIGEHEGQQFISMEFVDGEDLSSLLRRIGRMPEERAVEIARQLCAGLASAHEQGILHRDLKPANVMIDGRGRAKITDFGLADLSGSIEGAEVRAGTPAYMAPEQLEGSGVSEKSDIFSLALVLYELFTGKMAYHAGSLREISELRTAPPESLASHVPGLDPAIEAVVLRALDRNPANRPASALAVAAALPGGDPLAAALAAGETPSPEMVAEAGSSGSLSPLKLSACVLLILAGVITAGLLRPRGDVLHYSPEPLPVSSLAERARLMTERLGFPSDLRWNAHGVASQYDQFLWLDENSEDIKPALATVRPTIYSFWYRQSETRMTPGLLDNWISANAPPVSEPGMLRLVVDTEGRLVELLAVPKERASPDEEAAESRPSDDALWALLFEEAEIDPSRFESTAPIHTPPFFADAHAAWEGTIDDDSPATFRIEASGHQGRPVSFHIYGPWDQESDASGSSDSAEFVQLIIQVIAIFSVLIGLTLVGRRNFRSGRADTSGAIRVAIYIFVVEMLYYVVGGGYLYGATDFMPRVLPRLASALFLSMIVFAAYLAIEPYVRRLWPNTLIAWSRLIGGRLRDPLVGRDLLIGGLAGIASQLTWILHKRIPTLLGLPSEPLSGNAGFSTLPLHQHLSGTFNQLGGAVGISMMLMVSVVLLRLLLRNSKVAIAIVFLFIVVVPSLGSPHLPLDITIRLLTTSLMMFVMLRVGILALVSSTAFYWFISQIRTLDTAHWSTQQSYLAISFIVVITLISAWIAAGGRSLLADDL